MSDDNDFFKKHKEMLHGFYDELEAFHKITCDDASILQLTESAINYAKQGIQLLFIINGGALIALPAIVQAFNVSQSVWLTISAGLFVGGLLSIVLCILLAYFCACTSACELRSARNKNYYSFLISNWDACYGEHGKKALKSLRGFKKTTK